ncbi:hypothetical protein [Synechococcus sp. CCY9202]|nr:hypothetical protein [Synechococcus sp. CCY9202]
MASLGRQQHQTNDQQKIAGFQQEPGDAVAPGTQPQKSYPTTSRSHEGAPLVEALQFFKPRGDLGHGAGLTSGDRDTAG